MATGNDLIIESLKEKEAELSDKAATIDADLKKCEIEMQNIQVRANDLAEERAETIGGIRTLTELLEKYKTK